LKQLRHRQRSRSPEWALGTPESMLRSPESMLGSPRIGAHVPGTAAHITGIGAHERPERALTSLIRRLASSSIASARVSRVLLLCAVGEPDEVPLGSPTYPRMGGPLAALAIEHGPAPKQCLTGRLRRHDPSTAKDEGAYGGAHQGWIHRLGRNAGEADPTSGGASFPR
jgi:hypothetical protein